MTASVRPEGGPAAQTERDFPGLDGLRLVAATAIIVTHSAVEAGYFRENSLGRALSRLEVGVPVFFVLSGFLLSRPFLLAAARGTVGPRPVAYLWRRGLRILPAYWLMVAAALLVMPGNAGATAGTWLRYLTMTQLYSAGPPGDALNHTWSLCTEVAFYLLLPVAAAGLARLIRRRPDRPGAALAALAGTGLVAVVWTWYFAGAGLLAVPMHQWLPGFADWFGVGMALAVLTVADRSWPLVRVVHDLAASLPTCWAAAGVLFWIIVGPLGGPASLSFVTTPLEAVTKHLIYTAVAGLIVLPLVFGNQRRGAVRRLLSASPVRFLGLISYGIFLFHRIVLDSAYERGWFGLHLFTGNLIFVAGGTLLGASALAWASYALVEDPLSRFRGLVSERGPRHAAVTTSTTTASSAASTST